MKKEDVWLACRPKTCCRTAIVVPSGRDVWRIARALDAPAWSFLRYLPSPSPRPDAFYLDQSGQTYRLVLAKSPGASGRAEARPDAPCIFLLRTRDGAHRCGLGRLRPSVCQAFPSELVDGVLCVRNDGGCTCRRWTLADVDVAEEAELVRARQAEAVEYHDVVSRWNARVRQSADARFDFFDYCRFLLVAYDELAAEVA